MQICISPQTNNHASTSPLNFLQRQSTEGKCDKNANWIIIYRDSKLQNIISLTQVLFFAWRFWPDFLLKNLTFQYTLYRNLPSNVSRHFFIGSTTSMHNPLAEYDISLSPVKVVSGKDGSSSSPISGICEQCHIQTTKQFSVH